MSDDGEALLQDAAVCIGHDERVAHQPQHRQIVGHVTEGSCLTQIDTELLGRGAQGCPLGHLSLIHI